MSSIARENHASAARRIDGIGCSSWFAEYAAKVSSLIDVAPRGAGYPRSVAATFNLAIEQAVACYPATQDSGTIEYLADVSFSRHRVRVSLPRAGRSKIPCRCKRIRYSRGMQ